MPRSAPNAAVMERPPPYVCPVDGLVLDQHPPSGPIPPEYVEARAVIRRSLFRFVAIWPLVGPNHRRAIVRARIERGVTA